MLLDYLRYYGVKKTFLKCIQRKKIGFCDGYQRWFEEQRIDLLTQKKQKLISKEWGIKFSFVIPTFCTKREYLIELFDSIVAQTYSNYEICVADGSPGSQVREVIECREDYSEKIKYQHVDLERQNISYNTNVAIDMAEGDYIVFIDHDDLLEPNALFEVGLKIVENEGVDILYTDEDKVNGSGDFFYDPHFKPDFNPYLLRSYNYISHLTVMNKKLVFQTGYLDSDYNGAQDYDFLLRASEKTNNIIHVPKVLYHWRSHEDSTANTGKSKLYAYDAGAQAINRHLERVGLKGVVKRGYYLGLYQVNYESSPKNREIFVIEKNVSEIQESDLTKITEKWCIIKSPLVKPITREWKDLFQAFTYHPNIGIIGCRLYQKRGESYFHGGAVLGMGSEYLFSGMPRSQAGYMHREEAIQNANRTCTLFCLAKVELLKECIRREGSLYESALCALTTARGLQIIYNPMIEAYYLGNSMTDLNYEEGNSDERDPFYNVNLEPKAPGFQMK